MLFLGVRVPFARHFPRLVGSGDRHGAPHNHGLKPLLCFCSLHEAFMIPLFLAAGQGLALGNLPSDVNALCSLVLSALHIVLVDRLAERRSLDPRLGHGFPKSGVLWELYRHGG